eukprot:m51a1_g14393 hypothetical protein (132) ;mRNA; f:337797-339366
MIHGSVDVKAINISWPSKKQDKFYIGKYKENVVKIQEREVAKKEKEAKEEEAKKEKEAKKAKEAKEAKAAQREDKAFKLRKLELELEIKPLVLALAQVVATTPAATATFASTNFIIAFCVVGPLGLICSQF